MAPFIILCLVTELTRSVAFGAQVDKTTHSLRSDLGDSFVFTEHNTSGSDISPAKLPPHVVQHSALLNNAGLWWMLAVVVFCMGVMVVKMERDQGEAVPDEEHGTCDDAVEPWSTTIKRLVLSVVGLNVAMLVWGISQEQLMTTEYEHGDAVERVPSSLALVFLNRLCAVLVSALILKLRGYHLRYPGALYTVMPAATNLFSTWSQYQSLIYVSFPLQTAVKSAKLLPVLLISSLRGKRANIFDYAECAVVVVGLVVFGLETVGGGETEHHAVIIGILLLVGLLFVDSVTPHLQDQHFSKYPDTTSIQMSFSMAVFSCLATLVITLGNGTFIATMGFFQRHPRALMEALVLSLSSTITQFLISFTIKSFGPVVFVLISTTRQMISICVSAALFGHRISSLAWIASVLVFGSIIARCIRKSKDKGKEDGIKDAITAGPVDTAGNSKVDGAGGPPDGDHSNASVTTGHRRGSFHRAVSFVDALTRQPRYRQFVACALGINVPLAVYSVAREFMATHTFHGEFFTYPLFLIAVSHTTAAIVACVALKAQGLHIWSRDLWIAIFPGGVGLAATWCQYEALQFLRYPVLVLFKAMKLIPVMVCGRLLKNRSYSLIDYAEAVLITALVILFVVFFHRGNVDLNVSAGLAPGIGLMIGHIIFAAFSSNLEDDIYQRKNLDPAKMMLGMELLSGTVAWIILFASGELGPTIAFLGRNFRAVLPICVLMLADAAGAYSCSVTVRMFGPAVFTLLLMAHNTVSLLISVGLFNHIIGPLTWVCVVVVFLVILLSSLRRAYEEQQQPQPQPPFRNVGGKQVEKQI